MIPKRFIYLAVKILNARKQNEKMLTANNELGDNGAIAEYDMMFFDDLRILDPTTWQWNAPGPQGVSPGRRSYASAAILDGQYMTIAFGM